MPYWRVCQEVLDKIEQLENGTERMKLIKLIKTVFDDQGNSFMHIAAVKYDVVLVNCLIKLGFDVNARNKKGMVPLDGAIVYGDLEAADALVKAGANFENSFLTTNWVSALHYAVQEKNFELIKWLINRPSIPGVGDIDAKDSGGQTPLLYAIIKNQTEIVRVLIEAGCDLTTTDLNGHTPLICSLIIFFKMFTSTESSQNYEIVKMLIDAGSDVNHRDNNATTVLHYAAIIDRDFMITPLLLEKGAEINATDFGGWLPINLAIQNRNYQGVKGLIDAGSRLDWKNCIGNTLLHSAMECCEPKIVKLLLETGASIHAVNNDDLDPFSSGILYFYSSPPVFESWLQTKLKCLKLLLKRGTDVNRVSSKFGTALTIALKNNDVDSRVIPFLLNNKAIVDFSNEAVQDAMNSSEKPEVSRFLIKHVALCEMLNHCNKQIRNFCLDQVPMELKGYYRACKDELEQMKKVNVDDEFSLYDVLARKSIVCCVRNEKAAEVFERINLKDFPIYIEETRQRFEKETKKQKRLDEARNGLSRLIKWDLNAFAVVYDSILRFLPKNDLCALSFI